MTQGYHAYSLPMLHKLVCRPLFPFSVCFVLCVLACFACVFFLWFGFVFRFLVCDGIVTALDYRSTTSLLLRPLNKQTAIFASIN